MGIFAGARARIPILATATLGALPCLAPAATHFSQSFHDSGKAPTSMVAADFNGDGKLDLAIAFTQYLPGNNGKVGIQLNNASGAGNPPFSLNCTVPPDDDGQCDPGAGVYTVGKNPLHIATGVFNASGRNDLAVVNQGDATISILLNNGSGVFTVSSTTLSTGTNPGVIAVGDFNGDGKADIAVTNTGDNTVSVFLGDGSGGFSAAASPTFSTGSQPMGIDAADIDGDGNIDLVVANFGANTVSFHKGNGTGTFQSAVTKSTTYTGPVRVKAGFVDGDGFRDVAVASQDGSNGGFEVLLGNGTGALSASATRQVALNLASRFALGKWDGDQVDDVALTRASGSITVLETYQIGPVASIEDLDLGLLIDVTAGDFDGDGVSDLAALVRSSFSFDNYLVVLRKTHEAPAFISGTATLATTVLQAPGGNMSQFLTSGLPLPSYTPIGGGLPTGLSLSLSTGAISGAPALGTTGGTWFIDLQAANDAGGTATKRINVTVAKTTQAVTFNPPDMEYAFAPVQLTATTTATTGTFTFASLTSSVCTMDGAYVTTLAEGTCTVTVQHSGDTDYLASGVVQRSFQVSKASQSITFTAPATRRIGDGGFNFGVGGSFGMAFASSGLTIAVGSSTPGVCTVSGAAVTLVSTGQCKLTLDQSGSAIYAAAPQKIAEFAIGPNTVPAAPTLSGIIRGNGQASLIFFPTDNGGSTILDYTATCDPGAHTSPAGDVPRVVTGLANGTEYTCSVKARNSVGSSAASNTLTVTPAVAPLVTSGNSASFTRTQFGTFTATASGDPAPTFSITGSLPTGVSINSTSGVISGTPALGSAAAYLVQVTATNVAGSNSQFLTLSVAKLPQSITFAQPANKAFGSGNALMTATVPASGPVAFGTTTPSICAVPSSNSVQLLAVGTCQVTANHPGDPDYSAAPQVTRNFEITATVPNPPTNLQGTAGDAQATFAFSIPGSDGGSPITGYTVTCNPGNKQAPGSGSPITVTGLTNGTEYTCRVKAANAAGSSPESSFVLVTPAPPGAPQLQVNPTSVDFGGQSMGTTSTPRTVTLTNAGNAAMTVSQVSVSNAQFTQAHNCAALTPGASCTITLRFAPAVAPAALNAALPVSALLSVTSSAPGSPHTASLLGSAQKSLVTHYYRSILRRDADGAGLVFWQDQAKRVADLGVNVSEAWFALASQFYTSAEYVALNRDNAGYLTDLYNTFYNRPPDSAGLAFWLGNLDGGMPREVALAEFMFSTEFRNFARAIFGDTAARAEVDAVVDFYRGLLARLPDDAGFQFWVSRFRQAQCTQPASAAAAAIIAEVESISKAYTDSAEYALRGRANAQNVGDLYNAFLRRGGDLGGVLFWIGQLDSGARTREQLRVLFKESPEFQGRVNAIIAQGCS